MSPAAEFCPDADRVAARARRGLLLRWAFWVVMSIIAGLGLGRMHINNSLAAWSPGQTPTKDIATYVVVGFEPQDTSAAALEATLRGLPSVAWCFGPASEAALRLAGITPENLVRGDGGRYAGVFCFAKPGVDAGRFYADVSQALRKVSGSADKPDEDRFALGGSAAFSAALNEASQRRMPIILAVITIVGGALLWVITRSLRAAAAGLGAISLSMIILLGVASWAGVDFDMSLLLVPPLMISLGYSYAAHAALRKDATWALVICCGTSMLGVAAFGTADLPSIRAFALWGTIGVALVWACVVSLVPPPSRISARSESTFDRRTRRTLLRLVRRRTLSLVVAGLLVSAAGVALASSLSVEAQPLNYFADSERIARDNATLERRLTGMLPFEVVGPRSADIAALLRDIPQVRKSINVTAFTGRSEQVFWCLADNSSLEQLAGALERCKQRAASRGAAISIRGVAPQLLEVRRQMRRVAAVSIPSMLLVAALATGVLGRSILAALAGLLVNLIPVAGIVVMSWMFGWSIQMPTLMVGAIGIGAGIDDAIHLFWLRRYHPLGRTLRICLRACAGSSLIAAVCLAAFALSPFKPTAQFGLLMALILALAAVADMIVLPALMHIRFTARRRGPGSITTSAHYLAG